MDRQLTYYNNVCYLMSFHTLARAARGCTVSNMRRLYGSKLIGAGQAVYRANSAGSPGVEMFVVWSAMVPLIASPYLAAYLNAAELGKRRVTGRSCAMADLF